MRCRQESAKHYLGSLYYTVGVNILAPSFPFNYKAAIRQRVDPSRRLVVDLGCGIAALTMRS